MPVLHLWTWMLISGELLRRDWAAPASRGWGLWSILPFPGSDLAQVSAETCFYVLATSLFKMS